MFDYEPSTASSASSENSVSDEDDVPTENSEELKSLIAEDRRKWIDAIKKYVTETQAISLDLSYAAHKNYTKLTIEEIRSIFRILPNSQVTELILDGNDLSDGLEDLLQTLVATNINKLDMYDCKLYNGEMMRLMAVLKDTHVTELSVSNNGVMELSLDEENKFIAYLVASRLNQLCFDFGFFDPGRDPDFWNGYPTVTPFLRVIPTTTITNLSLSQISYCEDTLSSLFSNLRNTALTALSLSFCELKVKSVRELSLYLRDSNLVSLDLSTNRIGDAGIDALAVGLVCSKITALDISDTSFTGANSLGLCLKDSQIKILDVSNNDRIKSYVLLSFPGFLRYSSLVALDISYCNLGDKLGQVLMRSLKFSKITKLNVSSNNLQLLSASEFASVVNDTEIIDVDFSRNCIPFDGLVVLGNCLKDSKLKHIDLSNNKISQHCRTDPAAYSIFLEKTKESTLQSVYLPNIVLHADGMETIAVSLVNTTLTHLDLMDNKIGDGAVNLAAQLKFTVITHLNLSLNELRDAGAESVAKSLNETKITHLNLCQNLLSDAAAKALAKVLSETRLIELDLVGNGITSSGAKALAYSLKGSNLLHLDLSSNNIKNGGFEVLADHVEGTFLTFLDVMYNPGTRKLLIERILLKNKGLVHHFVSFFKRVAPESSTDSFRLDESVCNTNVDAFLEECLVFYKTVLDKPPTISVIVQEESFSFSWEQVVLLLRVEFPRQFATFVMKNVEATATQHVDFLKKVEELGLNKIVEILLLNRPALMIDENEDILHPYVYVLLHKYKQPLYNSLIEPEGKTKIVKYFSKNSQLESALEVINLLHNDKNSSVC